MKRTPCTCQRTEGPVVQGPPAVSEWERDHVGPRGCRGFSIAVSRMQRRWQEPEMAGESGGEERRGGSAPDRCGGGDEDDEH